MPSNLSQLLTKLCTSSKPKRLTPARKDLNNPEETASPHKLELKDQLTGKRHHFNLYHDRDLPFLQKRNGMMARNIHDATADDACYATFQLQGHDGAPVVAQVNSSWVTRVRRDDLLTLQVLDAKGAPFATLAPAAEEYGQWKLWEVTLVAPAQTKLSVEASDTGAEWGQWIAFGQPRVIE